MLLQARTRARTHTHNLGQGLGTPPVLSPSRVDTGDPAEDPRSHPKQHTRNRSSKLLCSRAESSCSPLPSCGQLALFGLEQIRKALTRPTEGPPTLTHPPLQTPGIAKHVPGIGSLHLKVSAYRELGPGS